MTRSRVVRVRATGAGHVMRRDAERVRNETSGIGPGSSGHRDGVRTGRGTSHNSYGQWLQLMHCASLLSRSRYFKYMQVYAHPMGHREVAELASVVGRFPVEGEVK